MPYTIVLARLVDHPFPRIKAKQAQALVWLNNATDTDVPAARAYAEREGYILLIYAPSEPDPLARARSYMLAQADLLTHA